MMLQPHPKNFPEGNKKWKLTHIYKPQQSTLAETSTFYYCNSLSPYVPRAKKTPIN